MPLYEYRLRRLRAPVRGASRSSRTTRSSVCPNCGAGPVREAALVARDPVQGIGLVHHRLRAKKSGKTRRSRDEQRRTRATSADEVRQQHVRRNERQSKTVSVDKRARPASDTAASSAKLERLDAIERLVGAAEPQLTTSGYRSTPTFLHVERREVLRGTARRDPGRRSAK